MAAGNQIKQAAIEIANRIQERALSKQKELAQIQVRKAQIEADIQSASLCRERVSSFDPEFGGHFQCPRCWIIKETRSTLLPREGADREDVLQCAKCQFELSLPFD